MSSSTTTTPKAIPAFLRVPIHDARSPIPEAWRPLLDQLGYREVADVVSACHTTAGRQRMAAYLGTTPEALDAIARPVGGGKPFVFDAPTYRPMGLVPLQGPRSFCASSALERGDVVSLECCVAIGLSACAGGSSESSDRDGWGRCPVFRHDPLRQ